jgi:hypothetical protein
MRDLGAWCVAGVNVSRTDDVLRGTAAKRQGEGEDKSAGHGSALV